jgi:hypothetical protein
MYRPSRLPACCEYQVATVLGALDFCVEMRCSGQITPHQLHLMVISLHQLMPQQQRDKSLPFIYVMV